MKYALSKSVHYVMINVKVKYNQKFNMKDDKFRNKILKLVILQSKIFYCDSLIINYEKVKSKYS